MHVHHYLASHRAEGTITKLLGDYKAAQPHFNFDLTFCHVMRADDVISDGSDAALVAIVRQYYDKSIENKHLGKDVWYGYKQCGLTVVLEHNAPNNSLALVWGQGKHPEKMRPLFPRKQRHVEHGQSV